MFQPNSKPELGVSAIKTDHASLFFIHKRKMQDNYIFTGYLKILEG
jgi:hypothetical protein